MASVVKRRVLEALAERLAQVVAPELSPDDVVVGVSAGERPVCFPNMVVAADGPFKFVPFDDDELWSTDTTLAVHVGDLAGQVEVTIGFTTQGQRELIEDRVLHEFFRQADRRGVLVLQLDGFTVNDVVNLKQVPIAYVLGDETWVEELAFDRKRFSKLTLEVDVPALVHLTGIYNVETLVLALTDDLESEVADLEVEA